MSGISLQKGINFRAFDHYEMMDGRRIRPNVLFRSGSLAELTPHDVGTMLASPVSHVLDYRDPQEAAMKPDVLWPEVFYECVPANPDERMSVAPSRLMNYTKNAQEAFLFMCDLYRTLPFQNKAYQRLADWLQNTEVTGIVQHCAIGKDRTGVGSAILLMILGASRATIVRDYLKTETTLAVYRARVMALVSEGRTEEERQAISCLFSADENFIVAALDTIEQQYGTREQYLREELGLNAENIFDIRARYLEV